MSVTTMTPSASAKSANANDTSSEVITNPGPLDLVKHRWWYIAISLLFVIPGLVFMALNVMETPYHAPVHLGIDFTGGTMLEYGFHKPLTQENLPQIRAVFDNLGYTGSVVQIHTPHQSLTEQADPAAISSQTSTKAPATTVDIAKVTGQPVDAKAAATEAKSAVKVAEPTDTTIKTVVSVRTKPLAKGDGTKIQAALTQAFGPYTLLQQNSLGPTMASELVTKGFLALGLAYLLIVGYLTFRFQFDFAICAIVALVHDTIFIFGLFAMLGYFFHTEIDSLFVTGILTVVGFSVHDTIVVFDRLRENSRVYFSKKLPFGLIANISVNQTLARSINTSLTAVITLAALFLFGGQTTRDFVLTMLAGIITGTFSSIAIASILLVMWRERSQPVASARA
jgi:preprotein translocase subunit SecF